MVATSDINKHTGLSGLSPFQSTAPVAAFNEAQLENLIKTKGILAFHVKHALNYNRTTVEVGLDVSQEGIERPFLYYDVKPIRLVPQHLDLNDTLTVMSLQSTGTTVFNTTGTYLDGTGRVFIRPSDIILLNPSVTDYHQELVLFTGMQPWKFQYRAKRIDYMASISTGRLEQDADFVLNEDGEVVFISEGRMPKVGEVVSVVYEFSPMYVVKSVPHVIRLLPSNTSGGGYPRIAELAPQLIIADRSTVREDTTNWSKVLEDMNWRQWLELTGT